MKEARDSNPAPNATGSFEGDGEEQGESIMDGHMVAVKQDFAGNRRGLADNAPPPRPVRDPARCAPILVVVRSGPAEREVSPPVPGAHTDDAPLRVGWKCEPHYVVRIREFGLAERHHGRVRKFAVSDVQDVPHGVHQGSDGADPYADGRDERQIGADRVPEFLKHHLLLRAFAVQGEGGAGGGNRPLRNFSPNIDAGPRPVQAREAAAPGPKEAA
ncbi:hypothetical protein [Candidatus Palauibacter sp.]|uniref:hypothetical protein n=1 Tax=Candidatus Palauibacter sp. TaxID=3101350 RepID=UPI003CC5A198